MQEWLHLAGHYSMRHPPFSLNGLSYLTLLTADKTKNPNWDCSSGVCHLQRTAHPFIHPRVTAFSWTSENKASTLLLERVVALLRESLHEDVVVRMLLHVFHYLGDRLGHGHAMNARLHSQLFNQLTLRLQSFLKLAHCCRQRPDKQQHSRSLSCRQRRSNAVVRVTNAWNIQCTRHWRRQLKLNWA